MTVTILKGDCREVLRMLPDESVHCVVTSPPYWGLRDYGTARWDGGDTNCQHTGSERWYTEKSAASSGSLEAFCEPGPANAERLRKARWRERGQCTKCGAIHLDEQLGMERSLGEHVATMVEVFREVRRVLRKDGTLWLNYGDSYAASPNGRSAADVKLLTDDDRTFRDKPFSTIGPVSRVGSSGNKGNSAADHGNRVVAGGRLAIWDRKSERNGHNLSVDDETMPNARIMPGGYLKPKDLCGIPWRVAFALQDDGWWLRQDIIWSKPNPMPESIKDRCTKAHEYIFLMAKSQKYYFDADAISERAIAGDIGAYDGGPQKSPDGSNVNGGRNYRGRASGNMTHKAVAEYESGDAKHRTKAGLLKISETAYLTRNKRSVWEIATSPFQEAHFATFPPSLIEPCILAGCPKGGMVLDPFGGAGTTGMVADRLGRNATLIELNPDYAEMAQRRIKQDAGMFAEVVA